MAMQNGNGIDIPGFGGRSFFWSVGVICIFERAVLFIRDRRQI